MFLTYRYRLVPTKRQHRALESILESQRQLYNAALEERIDAFRKAGQTRSYFDQTVALTEWRKSDDEARRLPVKLQRATLKRVDNAHRAFLNRLKCGQKAGFPRFRGAGRFRSFGFHEIDGVSLTGSRVKFKGMPGALRVHMHRPMPSEGVITKLVFCRDTKGWVICIHLELPATPARQGLRAVGIDLGIASFATLSNGEVIPSLRAARSAQRRLRTAHRALSRKCRISKGRGKAIDELKRCHAAIERRRANHIHQASARLVRDFDVIVIEKLQIKALASNHVVAKDIHDAAWGKFISTLRYKAEKAGTSLLEVDARNTSQDCSGCGVKVQKRLEVRRHECTHCGLVLDRDLNAARNILNRAGVGPGLLNVADCGMRAGGNLGSRIT